jgi:hypothetical protein
MPGPSALIQSKPIRPVPGFDAFSSRQPAPVSLENAVVASAAHALYYRDIDQGEALTLIVRDATKTSLLGMGEVAAGQLVSK